MCDLFNNINPLRGISPQVAVTNDDAFVSQIIDMRGYDSLTWLIATGSLADANATFAVLVEHADASDFSGSAAVGDEFLLGTEALAGFTFAADNATRKIGYAGPKRYVRLTITPTGNTGDVYLAAIALLGHPHLTPTVNPPAA